MLIKKAFFSTAWHKAIVYGSLIQISTQPFQYYSFNLLGFPQKSHGITAATGRPGRVLNNNTTKR
jgi:hypothetical protein